LTHGPCELNARAGRAVSSSIEFLLSQDTALLQNLPFLRRRDLPIEQPTKLKLIFSLKAAKALGLTIPPSLLLRADELIQ